MLGLGSVVSCEVGLLTRPAAVVLPDNWFAALSVLYCVCGLKKKLRLKHWATF